MRGISPVNEESERSTCRLSSLQLRFSFALQLRLMRHTEIGALLIDVGQTVGGGQDALWIVAVVELIEMSQLMDRLFEDPKPEKGVLLRHPLRRRMKTGKGNNGHPVDRIGLAEDPVRFGVVEIDIDDAEPPLRLLPVFILPFLLKPAEEKRRAVLIPVPVESPFRDRLAGGEPHLRPETEAKFLRQKIEQRFRNIAERHDYDRMHIHL